MKTYILNREIDNIRGTLFRQCMFAEFEKLSHKIVEENKPLTLDVMRNMYRDLLKTYFGETMVIDEDLTLECLRIPHFYSPFYVYQYATGISASSALVQQIVREGKPAVERYLKFLSSGSSEYSIELLKKAGVDMTSPEPVRQALQLFDRHLAEMEELIG